MNIEIANRLVELRKQKGLSQEELAERLGISRQAVSKWERAESSPEIDNVIELSRLYGVSIDQLLCTDMEPAATDPGEEPVRAAEEESELRGIVNLVCRVSGNVELKGSDGESHSVTLTGGERAKDDCRVYTEGDTLYIVSEDERRFTLFNFEKPLGVTAVLPRNMARIEVRLKGGRLRMNGIDMRELDAVTGGGGISAEDCTANELKMKTGGGSISVRDVAAGIAEMKTGGGSVSASGLSASESVTAETGGGGVCVSCEAPSVLARTGGGGIKLGCSRACQVTAKTGGGSIDIVLTECRGVDAALVTGSGSTKLIWDGEQIGTGRKLNAKTGDGSTRVEAKSGGGSIRVEVL